jgi:tetratricopeptide (TPR) repeat protein
VTLPLRPHARNALLVLICLGTLSIYVGRVVGVYLALRSADSSEVGGVERAIRLVPDNAEFPHLLGLQLSASDQDDDGAIASLRKAVTLNSNSGRYWLDLASVYQVKGNVEKQNEAVQSALNAEPGNPEVAAEAAQYFLVSGDIDRALPLFRQSLVQNPQAANAILQVCWRQTRDANLLLAKAIPTNPELQLEFLRILTEQKETPAAKQVWQQLLASNRSVQPQLSFFYFDYLLKEHEVASFDRAWHELAVLSPNMQAYLPKGNLIVNASFEQQLLNSGFDWRQEPADHVAAGIDDNVAHSGTHSLSLSYDGNPAYDAGWKQFVPVQSNTDYEFSAWIKSENVTSSSGPRIAIVDAYSGANLLLTDDVLDTHPWQEIKGTLRVPAETELLVVKIVRVPAVTRIRGRVWIDDLRLVKR